MAKYRDWMIGVLIVVGMLFLILIMVTVISQRRSYDGPTLSSRGDKIAIIELLGPIYDSRNTVRQFKQYGDHESVKAIVFRIDSPGGGVAASQEIYEAAKRVRDSGKPVVASMGTVAASGGYYVACGADSILANPGTTTGSIGVIAEFPNISGLLSKIGIRFETIKSGRYKDSGSPYRDWTSADRQYLQSWVDDAYSQFAGVVALERHIEVKDVKRLADGRVFTGRQAFESGLIDRLGDYEDAIELATLMGDIKGEPTIIKERRRRITMLDLLFQQAEYVLRGLNGLTLQYRWK